MKIAINKCYGGFDLSEAFYKRLEEKGVKVYRNWHQADKRDKELEPFYIYKESWGTFSNISDDRTGELLISIIEELGDKESSGRFGAIEIREIPDDVVWELDEYDGIETVREKSRSW